MMAASSGYLAVPASGSGPGLVLCQEIFGLNGFVRQTAERLAEEGYVVLAPDLFWRQQPGIEPTDGPDDMPRAFALYQGFDEDLGVRDIGSAVAPRALPEFKGGGAGLLPGRQAGLSGGLPLRRGRGRGLLRRRHREQPGGSVQAAWPAGAAHRRARRLLSSRGARAHPGGAGRQARRGAVRVSAWTTPSPAPAARTTTSPPR